MTDAYRAFLETKVPLATTEGAGIDPGTIHPILKPHQRAAVQWAVQGGRRALFLAFGLGKTVIQLETVRLTLAETGGRGLIVLPLGVRQEFTRDAAMLGLAPRFIRRLEEADATGIYLTNYETVRDDKLDPTAFDVVSLDEAAVLRGFGGTKTFRALMRRFEGSGKRRFVATATPDPNEYIELLAYAAFLDIMDVGEAKTRWFKRDSTKADKLTLHPHKAEEFWLWCASWALFLQTPSDLGPEYSDAGYTLPPMTVRWHELPSDHATAGHESDGQARMFRNAAYGVSEAAREKQESLPLRVAKVIELLHGREISESSETAEARVQGLPANVPAGLLPPDERRPNARRRGGAPGLSARVSSEESRAHPTIEPRRGSSQTLRGDSGDPPGDADRAGLGVCDLSAHADGAGGGSRSPDSETARSAVSMVQRDAGDAERRSRVMSASRGLPTQAVVWCDLNAEQRAIERALSANGISVTSLYGDQDIEEREQLLATWRDGGTTVFLSKPSMYGAGVNLQQCHRMIFAGITFKYYSVIQAIHRIYRFLQDQPVTIDLLYTEAERPIRQALEAKWARYTTQTAAMGRLIREYGLSTAAMAATLRRTLGVRRQEVAGDGYRCINADAVEETRTLDADRVGLIITSIPFSSQYEYTPSYHDFGHTESNAHFWRQMDFLTPELLRVLQPGRLCCVHVKDRIAPGGLTGLGFQTVQPFHAEAIRHYLAHGFAYLGMKTIVTDVVRENNQTYRLGWTEQCKDGSRMGVGMPEYVLLFRKPPTDRSNGYADVPVVKDKATYSLARWQVDAHGFARSDGNRPLMAEDLTTLPHERIFKLFRAWGLSHIYDMEQHVALGEAIQAMGRLPVTFMLLQPPSWHPDVWTDIARMRMLNMLQERKGQEMHLCPLQFDLVDRLIVQCSNPGDVIFDPFAGLMTVPYCAVKLGRRGLGIELNPGYFRDGVAYVESAAKAATVPTLFDLLADEASA